MSNKSFDLLHRPGGSFHHETWDLYDYLGMLDYSSRLRTMDEQVAATSGRTIVQDAYFAIQGLEPRGDSPLGKTWKDAMGKPEFRELQQHARTDNDHMALAVMGLARTVQNLISQAERTSGSTFEDRWAAAQDSGQELPVIAFGAGQIEKVDDDAEATAAFVAAVGASLEGNASERFEKGCALAARIDVRAFADLLGWARTVVSGAARKHRGGTEELTGYRQNGWTARTVATEMLAVADGDLYTLAKLADNDLTNREYKSMKPQGKGPVILLRDESGSMDRADRHPKAQAFELALADAFNREGRDLVSIRWSTYVADPYTYGTPGIERHLGSFFDGGTRPLEAIDKALEVADEYVPGADILILTDGSFVAPEHTSRMAAEKVADFKADGGRVWGVAFGDATERDAAISFGFCDGWVRVDHIGKGEKTAEILGAMAHRDAAGQKRRSL